MGLCDYDSSSSSDSDSSTVSVRYFEEDIRYHYPSSHKEGTASTRNRSHTTLSKKKRTWSETDNESDLPGVPDYPQPSGSSARFCYDSDAGSDSDDFMLENKKRRGAGNDGKPVVVPIASSVRDMDLDLGKSPGPLPPPAPRPTTTAVRNVLGRRRPGVYQPWKNRFHIGNLDVDVDGLGYLSINDPSSPLDGGREDEPAPRVAARPPSSNPTIIRPYLSGAKAYDADKCAVEEGSFACMC